MNLEQLKTLTSLKHQHSQQALSKILVRETALRNELVRLRALALETQSQPPEQQQLRAIGGDVIWLKWLGQAQQKLNIELAQILAQKESLMAQHRRENGRKLVAERLAEDADDCRRRENRKRQLNSAIDHSLLP